MVSQHRCRRVLADCTASFARCLVNARHVIPPPRMRFASNFSSLNVGQTEFNVSRKATPQGPGARAVSIDQLRRSCFLAEELSPGKFLTLEGCLNVQFGRRHGVYWLHRCDTSFYAASLVLLLHHANNPTDFFRSLPGAAVTYIVVFSTPFLPTPCGVLRTQRPSIDRPCAFP